MKNITTKYSDLIKKLVNQDELFHGFDDVVNLSGGLSRELYLGDVNGDVSDAIDMIIRFWNRVDDQDNIPVEERTPIKIFVDSYGGDLIAAYTIINAIELSKTPVWTINVGAAYSAGFFIFITGHYRIAYPLASFLYHEGSGGFEGDANKFRNRIDFYKKQLDQLKTHTLKYTSLTEADYDKILKDDYWLTTEEALEKGIVDEVATKGAF